MTIRHTATLLALSGLLALPASANLLEDSQGRIELRNM